MITVVQPATLGAQGVVRTDRPVITDPFFYLVMTLVVFVLVLAIGGAVNALAALLPFPVPAPLRLLVTIAIEVALMTWWLMPWLTRRLARWIYPARAVVG